jgi:hypothetical protein
LPSFCLSVPSRRLRKYVYSDPVFAELAVLTSSLQAQKQQPLGTEKEAVPPNESKPDEPRKLRARPDEAGMGWARERFLNRGGLGL